MSGKRRFRNPFAGAKITRGAMYLLFIQVGFSLVYLVSKLEVRADIAKWTVASGESSVMPYPCMKAHPGNASRAARMTAPGIGDAP